MVDITIGLSSKRSSIRRYRHAEDRRIFKAVQIEAYSINGNNYCKLRDIGKAVGFNVSYDAASNTVVIKTDEPYAEDAPAQTSRVVRLPTDGSQYVPQVGDLIPCGDGTEYEIKDVVRWDTNVFADGPLPPLPTPTCDWGAFPTLELPEPIVKHYRDQHGDDLFIRNVYEVRRMVYTIYNAIGEEPDAWRDGKPLCKIYTLPADADLSLGTDRAAAPPCSVLPPRCFSSLGFRFC